MADEKSGIIELDVATFHEITRSDGVIVIHISADWCSPCTAFTAVFHDTAVNHDDVVFATLDTDKQPELSAAFEVTSIPTVAVLRGGALIFTHEGSLSATTLTDVICQAREVDLDAVRASMAAAKAKERQAR